MSAFANRLTRRTLVTALAGGVLMTPAGRPAVADQVASTGTPGASPASSPVASPAASPGTDPSPTSLVVAGLNNPRGMAFRPDGTLLVATGGNPGPNAALVEVSDGCPRVLVGGLPTARVAFRAVVGVADVAVLDGRTYLLLAGGNIDGDAPPNGVYEVSDDGSATLTSDISTFIRDNPVAEIPGDYDTDGQPHAMLPDPSGDGFLVTEGNSNQLLRVSLGDGSVERVADLSAGHPIPTGLALDGDGAPLVAYFTAAPYAEGSARVVRVLPDGSTADAWTGLSLLIDLAVGPDGALWALEMATGHGDDPGAIRPGTGRILRRGGDGVTTVIATGLELPSRMRFAPDDSLYVSGPAFGSDTGEGWVIRLAPSDGIIGPHTVPAIATLTGDLACPT